MFAESTVALGPMFAREADIQRMLEGEKTDPVHVIIGERGFRRDSQDWPKRGLLCQGCLTIIVNVRNR
jgi:hypothetical protein